MKKDILASEDFEPPSPVSGLGEHKVESGSDSSPDLKETRKYIHPEGTSFPEVSLQPFELLLSANRFFPEATPTEWNDWRWQLRARIRDIEALSPHSRTVERSDWP